MRRVSVLGLFLLTIICAGCHKRALSEFKFKAGMSPQDYEDQLGSPTRTAANWVGYTLDDGNELRLYFLEGPRGTVRTLTEADLYSPTGVRISELYNLKERTAATQPATNPATAPATAPATEPTTTPTTAP